MYCAVLFDWDGTLADTREVIVASFKKVAQEEVGVSVSAEFIERRIGLGATQTFREILQSASKPIDKAIMRKLLARKIEAEISLGETVKLFPGVHQLLEMLQGKVKLALASMNNRAVIEDLLDKLKIRDCFKAIITVEDVTKFKPDPEIFLKSATALQCCPKKCVVVEDSIFGVQAARNGGMDCIAVLTGVYSKKEFEVASPNLIVESLAENEEIFKFILQ